MKKLFILLVIFLIPISVCAKTLDAKISYDWVTMAQNDRDSLVNAITKSMTESDYIPNQIPKKIFKDTFKIYLIDKNTNLHYYQAKSKITKTDNYKISGFFKGNLLILYAIQYNNDKLHNYYYDAFGKLRFVDYISYDYPNFPYYTKQFDRNGKAAAYFYYLSDNMHFIFDDKFNFKGVWQNEKMYNLNGKIQLIRSEYSY